MEYEVFLQKSITIFTPQGEEVGSWKREVHPLGCHQTMSYNKYKLFLINFYYVYLHLV